MASINDPPSAMPSFQSLIMRPFCRIISICFWYDVAKWAVAGNTWGANKNV